MHTLGVGIGRYSFVPVIKGPLLVIFAKYLQFRIRKRSYRKVWKVPSRKSRRVGSSVLLIQDFPTDRSRKPYEPTGIHGIRKVPSEERLSLEQSSASRRGCSKLSSHGVNPGGMRNCPAKSGGSVVVSYCHG